MRKIYLYVSLLMMLSCSLDEEILDEYSGKDLLNEENIGLNLIAPSFAYLSLLYSNGNSLFCLNEYTSDEMMVPHWQDGGTWKSLYQHSWTINHSIVQQTWQLLDQCVGLSNTGIQLISGLEKTSENDIYIAELRFLRAFYRFWQLDIFRQVPLRHEMDLNFIQPPKVISDKEAMDWLINELQEVIPLLKQRPAVDYGRIPKSAAQFLLAKIYLNSKVYSGSNMYNECLKSCNEIIESGHYDISIDYFNIFEIDNSDNVENIFVIRRDNSGNLLALNCNSTITLPWSYGFGGACAVPDFVYSWDQDGDPSNGINSSDFRFSDDRTRPETGMDLGFLIGQQYYSDGSPIPEWIYTIDFNIPANPYDGVRVLKYEPDFASHYSHASNDIIIFRYSDVILMAAEAKFRLGNISDAMDDINSLRQIRNAPPLVSLAENDILKERGFELYWEGWRRQDLIRFGQFSRPWGHKPESEAFKTVFPIPDIAMSSNINLKQNPGY